jgi:hypothetical protein
MTPADRSLLLLATRLRGTATAARVCANDAAADDIRRAAEIIDALKELLIAGSECADSPFVDAKVARRWRRHLDTVTAAATR